MNWYAIRTSPGSQAPRREYWKEPSASALKGGMQGKGYRLASSLNPERSAIEDALERARLTYYMPAEFSAVRNRHRKGAYELRRFALLKGYAFVCELDGSAISRLSKVSGFKGLLTDPYGSPLPISSMDIHHLRMYEANSRAEAQAKVDKLQKADERALKEKRKAISKGARKKLFPGREVRLIWGDKVGREATVAAWQDQDKVRVIVSGLDGAEAIVPYEFLKAAE